MFTLQGRDVIGGFDSEEEEEEEGRLGAEGEIPSKDFKMVASVKNLGFDDFG